MKSVLFNKIEKEKSEELGFPVLAESISNGAVVLFLSRDEGVIVKASDYTSVGEYSDCYYSVDDKTRWRILSPEESIVLSND